MNRSFLLLLPALLLFACNNPTPNPTPQPTGQSIIIAGTPNPTDFKLAKGQSTVVTVKLNIQSSDVKTVDMYSDVTYLGLTVTPLNSPKLTSNGELQFKVELASTTEPITPSFRIYAIAYDKDGRTGSLVQPSALLYKWSTQ